VTEVFVCGLATDYCVKATALDALRVGLATTALTDCMRGVDVQPGDSQRALDELSAAGAEFADSESLS
jgi:nicotinamidase/pyrazinamidase